MDRYYERTKYATACCCIVTVTGILSSAFSISFMNFAWVQGYINAITTCYEIKYHKIIVKCRIHKKGFIKYFCNNSKILTKPGDVFGIKN